MKINYKIILFMLVTISFIYSMEEIPQSSMEVIYVDSEETSGEDGKGDNVLDGDPETIWHTEWNNQSPEYPHEIVLKLDKEYSIENFSYLPRQNSSNGRIKDFQLFISNDTSSWGEFVTSGTWIDNNKVQNIEFSNPMNGQYIKLKGLSEVNENVWASAAEINLNVEIEDIIDVDIDGWASSLHLGFRDDSPNDARLLMVDIEVDSSSKNTYYAPINFTGGYCGIQDHDSYRTLHFSLWDYVDGDAQSVPDEAKAKILWRGFNVNGSGFGGEGTGVKTSKTYPWKNDHSYRLVVKMNSVTIDSFPGSTRDYWVYDFETTEWLHIATLWRAANPTTGVVEKDLGEVHTFVEDWARTSELHRSCYVFNAQKMYYAGTWHTYEKAYYDINDQENNPNTADGHDPNTQCELRDGNKIWLATGGNFVPENRNVSGTTFHFTPNNNLDPENPGLIDIEYEIVNDSTVKITWDYEDPLWAAQESFDIRIYSDKNMNNVIMKTGDLFPYNYESFEFKKGSSKRYQINGLDFSSGNKYYLRIITKTIFGINCWNSSAIEISAATSIKKSDEKYADSFELKQNYPNPFNPKTTIEYSLVHENQVTLEVYDINGKKIIALVNKSQNSGIYSVNWDGTDENNVRVASGVYFYVLKSGERSVTNKMVLLE